MLQPGFDNPVHASQQTFRTVLAALAEPLQPLALPHLPPQADQLRPATLAVLLTLLDGEVTLASLALTADDRAHLRFHTGVAFTETLAGADFIVVPAGGALPDLVELKAGEAAYPDRSATLIIEVDGFDSATGVLACGPGFATPRRFAAQGLTAEFWPQWRSNHARFPLGIDVLLISPDAVAGLPRTTAIEEA